MAELTYTKAGRIKHKIMKGNEPVRTTLFVPNTPEGRKLIEDIRKHFNHKYHSIRVLARGKREDAMASYCLKDKANYFGVYITTKGLTETQQDYLHRLQWNLKNAEEREKLLRDEVANLKAQLQATQQGKAELASQLSNARLENSNLVARLQQPVPVMHPSTVKPEQVAASLPISWQPMEAHNDVPTTKKQYLVTVEELK